MTEILRRSYLVARDAFWRFVDDDGWAIASHLSLSALMSLFPFLMFVTALAGFLSNDDLARQVVDILLEAWPEQVAQPISREITTVLTSVRADAFTFGVLFAVYFSSSGIESLRIGLNRAYGVRELRSWYWCRLESIFYVILGAAALLVLSFLIVLGPLIWQGLVHFLPWLSPLSGVVTLLRFGVAAAVIVVALILVHLYLPANRRRLRQVMPGVVVTLILWLVSGALFGRYLASFSQNYVSAYAGLASFMIALVYLYWVSSIFIYGGELNAAIARERLVAEGR